MLPVLGHVGGIEIRSFGLLLAVAFIVAGVLMHRDFARKGEPTDLAWAMVGAALLGGLLGARLHLAVEYPQAFLAAPLTFLASRSGFVWYGGLAGGLIATLWPIRHFRVPWASAADSAAPALALALAVGRIGCHLAGDGDWGTPSALPWAVAYTNAEALWPHPPGVRVHPAALYESLALAVLALVLWRRRDRIGPPGAIFGLYVMAAGVIRFLVEAVRTNPPVAAGLTEAQWTSLAVVAAAGVWLARHRPRARETSQTQFR
jgi:phosphatidylglycerol---prolipoprotein diacylglyceryl transferase